MRIKSTSYKHIIKTETGYKLITQADAENRNSGGSGNCLGLPCHDNVAWPIMKIEEAGINIACILLEGVLLEGFSMS